MKKYIIIIVIVAVLVAAYFFLTMSQPACTITLHADGSYDYSFGNKSGSNQPEGTTSSVSSFGGWKLTVSGSQFTITHLGQVHSSLDFKSGLATGDMTGTAINRVA